MRIHTRNDCDDEDDSNGKAKVGSGHFHDEIYCRIMEVNRLKYLAVHEVVIVGSKRKT
jgi:hypothetical protein